jgi:hypothetical protein
MQSSPAGGSTFICFLLFAFYAGIHGYSFHYKLNSEAYPDPDLDQEIHAKTQRALLFAISAILVVSAVFYTLHKCVDSYCMLILRLIANFCAMVIYLGFACGVTGVLDEDGNINTNVAKDYSFSNASEWSSTVAFAGAWIMISTFEIYEMGFTLSTQWVVKMQVFLFWALLATCFCISGEKLLADVDMDGTGKEDIYAKLLLGVAGSSALAALLFLFFCMCELTGEFVRFHMFVGGLTSILLLAAFGYQTYEFRKAMKEFEEYEFYDAIMTHHNINFAGQVCLSLAIMATVGFDSVFFAPVVHGPNPSSKQGHTTIQIALA